MDDDKDKEDKDEDVKKVDEQDKERRIRGTLWRDGASGTDFAVKIPLWKW